MNDLKTSGNANMGINGVRPSLFPPEYRASGLLLHVTSLPSKDGIGDVGPEALAWIDQLRQAGQSWWQALPRGPTGYGNSPYQPLSSFAGEVHSAAAASPALQETEVTR
jgi:4-alpha-glucanotransferase